MAGGACALVENLVPQHARLDAAGSPEAPGARSDALDELFFDGTDRDVGVRNLYRLAADGSGEPERLAPSDQAQYVSSWSSEGVIAFLEGGDIWLLPPDGGPVPFFSSEATELDATFSSDGRWLAYGSNRSGRAEVYVRPYPGPEPATLISTDRGENPAWSPDDRQLYYIQPSPPVLMAVDVTLGDDFQAGRPTALIDPWLGGMWTPVRFYDVLADGSLVIAVADDDGRTNLERFGATELHVILNWAEELKARVPLN